MNWMIACILLGADEKSLSFGADASRANTLSQQLSADDERRQRLRQLLDESVGWNEFSVPGDDSGPVTAVPVHRWTNNERDPQGQALAVLWVHRGQPVAIASIFPWNGRLIHEIESTSPAKLQCKRDGVIVWKPDRGVTFTPMPEAPAPGDSAVVRLRQMKQLADQFQITMLGWKADDSDREELRRLPREMFRYQPETPRVRDGAVFAYVKGTDPEAVLVLEAAQTEEGCQWQYALVRQTSGGLTARRNGLIVWTAEKHVPRKDPSQPWISLSRPLPGEALP
ncbi:MAG: hypothetical protein SFV23_19845 [Planctomycetaceae bacterium]|nr:hypothetical protein [Planctomycetaceae bacterium]